MAKLFLTESQLITNLEGKCIELTGTEYNLTDEKLAIKNEFFKCHKCKNYFDTIHSLSQYHERYDEKEYCKSCLQKVL
jgi:hypothetical protein